MNVTSIYQSHEGAVNTSTSPKVVFGYDTTLSGDVYAYGHRRNQVTYPDGRVVFYDFDTANPDYPFSKLSKVRRIRETNSSGTILAEYSYSGEGRLAISDLQEPDVKLDYFQGTSGTYAGFDRFGRTKDLYWKGYGSTADVDRFKYSYDYAGNRTSTDIDSAIYAGNNKDEVYTYDSAHRLKNFDEGTLSGASITGTPVQEQDWSLDALGNWSNYVKKASGTTSLNQNRTVNPTNEITNITETTGPSWITPAYDAAGSMTTIPQPNSLTAGYTATFDAWHRLVKLANGATTVAEYEYDATKQRIVKSIYASGTLDHREHFYYNSNWQVLESRKEVSGTEDADPLSQYVWHPYYIDALILRDYDSDTDGASIRYYYTQDTIFNVVSILNASGTMLERYGYTPYGQAEVLDANFSADSDGLSDMANDVTFTGQRFDPESGLMLYRHRYYHPVIGTFCSKDPIGFEGSRWNLFEYVLGSPLNYVDHLGLGPGWPDDCCGAQSSKGINYATDLARQLRKKINAYRGAGDKQDIGHHDRIKRDCKGLQGLLDLLNACSGPLSPAGQSALDIAKPILDAVNNQCNDPNLRPPKQPLPTPQPDPSPQPVGPINRTPIVPVPVVPIVRPVVVPPVVTPTPTPIIFIIIIDLRFLIDPPIYIGPPMA
jgi:RHS repeat-associated protein